MIINSNEINVYICKTEFHIDLSICSQYTLDRRLLLRVNVFISCFVGQAVYPYWSVSMVGSSKWNNNNNNKDFY